MALFVYVLALTAICAPYFLWRRWLTSVNTVYQGQALIMWLDQSGIDRSVFYAFFQVPGIDRTLMERIPAAYADPRRLFTAAKVVVKKRTFGEAWIESVEWEDGQPVPIERVKTEGLLITTYYMFVGLIVAMCSMSLHLGHPGYWLSALTLATAGFCMNRKRFTRRDTIGESRFLGVFKVGKGKVGLVLAGTILALITGLCFWTPSIFMLLPGINCAFELGGIAALLATTSDTDEPTSRAV